MKQIDELIAQFQAVAANPAKAVADYKAETGKGAVGMTLAES